MNEELAQKWEQLSPEAKAKVKELRLLKKAKTNLAAFGEYVFGHKPAFHHQQIIDFIENNPNDDILIVAPPRHAKTTWVGVILPTFLIGQDPSRHIVYASATNEQSVKQSIEVKETIENSEYFHNVFPDVTPSKNRQWAKHMWTIQSPRFRGDKDPTFIATGYKGNILGSTSDITIIDDLNDDKNTATPYMRQKVQDWVVRTLMTRRSPRGRIICIMTRWHSDDLAGFFKKIGFKTLVLQAIGCGGMEYGCHLEHVHRPLNEPLWDGSDNWPLEKLLKIKSGMDMWQWEGVYQGNPTPVGGSIFKEEWWRYYRTDWDEISDQTDLPPLPTEFHLKIQSWDTSQKTGEENDWSVCTTWGWGQGNYYLLDVFRAKLEYPDLKRAVIAQYVKHKPGIVLVEDASSGASLLQELPIETSLPILGIKPESDKQSRARAASVAMQAARVYLPAGADWLYIYVSEMSDFPMGSWRDQVDSTSQAITWIRQNTGEDSSFADAAEELSQSRSRWAPTASEALSADWLVGEGLGRWSRFD